MPRCARKKSLNSIFHVMVRSISDINLFKNNKDSEKFLMILKKYQIQFNFKIYAYCLMSTHGHFIIDANGADISKFMHGINQSYAQYYNKIYNRHGHVFQDRFKSLIVNNDKYLLTLSAYIHKNPKDILTYKNNIQNYRFSSLGIYLGIRKDNLDILDANFIMQQLNPDIIKARVRYINILKLPDNISIKENINFSHEKSEYRSELYLKSSTISPTTIINIVSSHLKTTPKEFLIKNNKTHTNTKAICVFLIRRFCNFTCKDICKYIGNLTQARVSTLCSVGIKLINDDQYKSIISHCKNL